VGRIQGGEVGRHRRRGFRSVGCCFIRQLADQGAQSLGGCGQQAAAFRQRYLGACRRTIGLMLVRAGKVASLETAADIFCQFLRADQALAGQQLFAACPLPVPPGITHGGGSAQLRGRHPAVHGFGFGVGQGALTGAFAG
jgi:hypothetical protein